MEVHEPLTEFFRRLLVVHFGGIPGEEFERVCGIGATKSLFIPPFQSNRVVRRGKRVMALSRLLIVVLVPRNIREMLMQICKFLQRYTLRVLAPYRPFITFVASSYL